tara:strand:+ start:90 stop:269 length:180 start_codon:yes stop_codon:yes gene_type:complete
MKGFLTLLTGMYAQSSALLDLGQVQTGFAVGTAVATGSLSALDSSIDVYETHQLYTFHI